MAILLRALLFLLLAAILALGLAVAFRTTLAEAVLARVLAAQGLDGGARVTRLDLDGLELTRIRLAPLEATGLAVDYRLSWPPAVTPLRITVESPRLALDLAAADPLAPLDPLIRAAARLAGDDAAAGPAAALPTLRVSAGELRADTAEGPATVTFDADLMPQDGDAAELATELRAVFHDASLVGRVTADLRDWQPRALLGEVSMALAGQPDVLRLNTELVAEPTHSRLDADLRASVDPAVLARLPWPVDLQPESGTGQLRVVATADLPRLPAPTTDPAPWLAWLRQAEAQVTAGASFDGASLPGRVDVFAGDLGAHLRLRDGVVTAQLRDAPFQLAVQDIDPGWLSDLGLPLDLALPLAGGGALEVAGLDDEQPLLRLERLWAPADRQLSVAARVTLVPRQGGRLSLEVAAEQHRGDAESTRLAADLVLVGDALTHPAGVEGLSLQAAARLIRVAAVTELHSSAPWRLSADNLAPSLTAALGLPAALQAQIGTVPTLRLTARPDGAPALRLRLEDSRATAGLATELALTAAEGSLAAELSGNLTLDLKDGLQAADLESLSLDAAGWRLPAVERTALRFQGALRGAPGRWRLDGDVTSELGDLRSGTLSIDGGRLTLPLRAEGAGAAWTVGLTGQGRFRLRGGAVDEVTLDSLDGTIDGLDLDLTTVEDSLAAKHRLSLALAPLQLSVERDDGPLAVTLDGIRGTLAGTWQPDLPYRGDAALTAASVDLPEGDLALRDLALDLSARDDGSLTARLRRGELRDLAAEPRFRPLRLGGEAALASDRLAASFDVLAADGAVPLEGSVVHDLGSGQGSLSAELSEVVFTLGALQPAALSPRFAGLDAVSGRLGGRLALIWNGETLESDGSLDLSGFAFTHDGLLVEGLDLSLLFDNLQPPTTPPGQILSIRRLEAGAPLEDLRATLQLRAGTDGAPRVAIESLQGRFAEGDLRLRPVEFALPPDVVDLAIEAEGIDLAALSDLLALEEIRATGRLSGVLPLRLEGDDFAVPNARVTALGPGTLALTSAEAKQSLAPGGGTVALMLDALDDFRYDALELDIDKPAAGETVLRLRLQGHNPAVLEGYPFNFNITLAGDAVPILYALGEGKRMSDAALQRLWRLRQ